ncbi:MAG TPA: adenosine kinase, partial [Rhodobacter sp.]|nr:adenosine kinase [Rhodobacter sp.]
MKKYQVIGIGNAMVDVLSYADDAMLARHDITKGVMQLIDMPRAVALYSHIGSAQEVSGGSAANSIAAIAHLGGRTAYVGKVCDDQLGAIFAHDLRAQGAVYETKMAPMDGAQETGRCIVLVTPDGERTLNTYLGWSEFLTADDIITDDMAQAEWIYLEGYRFDGPESHAAFSKAIAACKGASGKVSITLSDPFCVERHRFSLFSLFLR